MVTLAASDCWVEADGSEATNEVLDLLLVMVHKFRGHWWCSLRFVYRWVCVDWLATHLQIRNVQLKLLEGLWMHAHVVAYRWHNCTHSYTNA